MNMSKKWYHSILNFAITLSGLAATVYSAIDALDMGLYASHAIVIAAGMFCATDSIVRQIRILRN